MMDFRQHLPPLPSLKPFFSKNMRAALTQGMLNRRLQTLNPSLTAVGPNTYLTTQDFYKMLGAAFALHLLVFLIAGLFPSDKVTNIPVRALSFKLGDQDRIAAQGSPGVSVQMHSASAAPVMTASHWSIKNPLASAVPAALKTKAKNNASATYQPVKQSKITPINEPPHFEQLAPLPQVTTPTPKPLIPTPAPAAPAQTPQQYVREVGAPTPQVIAAVTKTAGAPDGAVNGKGTETTMTEQSVRAIRDRYELEISNWIQQHKSYPAAAAGHEGRAVVRMRIDRAGNLRYYAIETSSGNDALDAAAIDMLRRANPVPAVPANYPAGTLVEFLIPITFKAPS